MKVFAKSEPIQYSFCPLNLASILFIGLPTARAMITDLLEGDQVVNGGINTFVSVPATNENQSARPLSYLRVPPSFFDQKRCPDIQQRLRNRIQQLIHHSISSNQIDEDENENLFFVQSYADFSPVKDDWEMDCQNYSHVITLPIDKWKFSLSSSQNDSIRLGRVFLTGCKIEIRFHSGLKLDQDIGLNSRR